MIDAPEMNAVILAGGLGTRLRPVLANQPKVLATVCGRPFVEYLLDKLISHGIRKVVFCTGYQGEQIKSYLGESYRSLNLEYSHESSPLGTGGALRLALPLIKSDYALVLNGDSLCTADLNSFVSWHFSMKSNATLLLVNHTETGRYGRVEVNDKDLIVEFVEKNDNAGPGWINAGIYLIKKEIIQTISENRPVSLEKEIFPFWISRGLYGYRSEGKLLDIGTPESYKAAEQFFKSLDRE